MNIAYGAVLEKDQLSHFTHVWVFCCWVFFFPNHNTVFQKNRTDHTVTSSLVIDSAELGHRGLAHLFGGVFTVQYAHKQRQHGVIPDPDVKMQRQCRNCRFQRLRGVYITNDFTCYYDSTATAVAKVTTTATTLTVTTEQTSPRGIVVGKRRAQQYIDHCH